MIAFGQFGSSETCWLTVVNIGLGIVVLLGLLAALAGVVQESICGRRKSRELSRELDRDLKKLVEDMDRDLKQLSEDFENGRPDRDIQDN